MFLCCFCCVGGIIILINKNLQNFLSKRWCRNIMKAVEYGKNNKDVIILLHGGGLSWWNYEEVAEILADRFHIVMTILNGHSGCTRPIRMFFKRYGVTPFGVAPFFSLLSYNAVFLRISSCFFHHSNNFFLCRNTNHSDIRKINIYLYKTMTA